MAIINRTNDSFYAPARLLEDSAALENVSAAVAAGADIIDLGGVKAGPGQVVSPTEEIDRIIPFLTKIRTAYPHTLISVDTWRAEVAEAAVAAGADIINDAWGAFDPDIISVATHYNTGLVCTHTGGATPRTRPSRVGYPDVMGDICDRTGAIAARGVALGMDPSQLMLDPGHDFGKNTRHSLTATTALPRLVALGYPVLVSLSRKDFVSESLGGRSPEQRLHGTLAATAISYWLGARIFRAHDVAETREVLSMVQALVSGEAPLNVRGLL